MTITLEKKQHNGITFLETEILGAKVTISKALTDHLKQTGKLKKQIETTDDMVLVATTKEGKGGKVWANLFLTIRKFKSPNEPNFEEVKTDDDLPF